MPASITATIDLKAFQHNLALAHSLAPSSRIMAVVKANAYGHGMIALCRAISQQPHPPCQALAVARLSEAVQLRDAGIHLPIVIMSECFAENDFHLCSQLDLQCVLHDMDTVKTLALSKLEQPICVWLKIDTGMHRLGLLAEELQQARQWLKKTRHIAKVSAFSHFATSDETNTDYCEYQRRCFGKATEDWRTEKSLANSAAILAFPHSHYDWVRPGIMLYGANPLDRETKQSRQLKPVMRLSSQVIGIREIPAGDSVGYNRRWHSARQSRIGTIAIGYADGYPRHAKNGTPVLIRNHRVPLVGTVSMDMITVDLTDYPDVQLGDEAVLWGDKQLSATEVAHCAGTISYQLFTNVGGRCEFVYR